MTQQRILGFKMFRLKFVLEIPNYGYDEIIIYDNAMKINQLQVRKCKRINV